MAWIIFLAPADLGETVLATGALAHALRKEDDLTIVASPQANALFRAAPAAKICTPSEHPVAFALLTHVQRAICDVLIDARGGVVGRLIAAKSRVRLRPATMLRHRTEEWGEALAADRALAPSLWLDDAARHLATVMAPGAAPLLLLAPGGATEAKRWSHERFAAVARRLVSGPLAGARIIVLSAAPRDADISERIVSSLDADGVAADHPSSAFDLLAAAALAERATLCIGNDNALTHIAAAAGAPTLTLFGPTDERVRAPHGPRTRTLRGRSFEEIAAASELDARGAMDDISIDAVEAAALELLHAGGLR